MILSLFVCSIKLCAILPYFNLIAYYIVITSFLERCFIFMQKVYVNFPSITFALKADKLFRLNHINSNIVRTPTQFSSCGCSYSIIINKADLEAAKSILTKNNVVINDIVTL